MTGKPVAAVGLTCSTIGSEAEHHPHYLGQNASYVQALVRAGAAPVLIPSLTDLDLLRSVYERIDALLLPGGGDIAPEHFGEKAHEKCGTPDPDRDHSELALIHWCVADHKPLLAICRGIQVLNVALGGSLYQDIGAQVQDAGRHDWSPGYARDFLAHPVGVAPGTRLAAISERGAGSWLQTVSDRAVQLEVNSFHHQAIKDLAPGLRVVARAPDGLVEAVEIEDHPFALGVQWHPEELAHRDNRAQQLFSALIDAIDL